MAARDRTPRIQSHAFLEDGAPPWFPGKRGTLTAWQILFVACESLPGAGEAGLRLRRRRSDALYLIRSGRPSEIHDRNGALVSLLGPAQQYRRSVASLRDGKAATSARVAEDRRAILLLPATDLPQAP